MVMNRWCHVGQNLSLSRFSTSGQELTRRNVMSASARHRVRGIAFAVVLVAGRGDGGRRTRAPAALWDWYLTGRLKRGPVFPVFSQ